MKNVWNRSSSVRCSCRGIPGVIGLPFWPFLFSLFYTPGFNSFSKFYCLIYTNQPLNQRMVKGTLLVSFILASQVFVGPWPNKMWRQRNQIWDFNCDYPHYDPPLFSSLHPPCWSMQTPLFMVSDFTFRCGGVGLIFCSSQLLLMYLPLQEPICLARQDGDDTR